MKKTLISLSLTALFSAGMAQAVGYTPTVTTVGNNFTMVSAANGLTGGTNDVTFTWDGTYRGAVVTDGSNNATLSSPTAFAGKKWTAHHVNVYGPGTYTFNTGCASGGVASTTFNPSCGTGPSYTLTVPAGKVGAHMLFDWSTSTDIDVVLVWEMNNSWAGTGTASAFNAGGTNTVNTVWNGVSADADGDGWNGAKMIDGPFVGQSANFSVNGISSATPVVSTNNPTGASVGTGATVVVDFNQAMNPATLTTTSFTVKAGGVGATVCGGAIVASNSNKTFTCTPTALAASTAYTATITTAATSAAGFTLATNYTWNFTTGAAASTLALSATGTAGTTTVTIPGGNGSLASVGLLNASQVNATPPAGLTFNEGLVNYKITGVGAGSTVPVTITFPASIVGKTLYKVNSSAVTPVYTAIPEAAFTRNGNGTTITMNVTDCTVGPCAGYDTNATAGIIEDPIGAGAPVAAATVSTLSSPGASGGGCTINHEKSDLSLIVVLFASLGYLSWRRKANN
ncbi:Ig-like domain-containing protein [Sulfurirhabdus autotrophica]|uniref:Ig-like domain-containing protein n=1 Tax=Sulfurirhabdus autotrophica TaxID=1706046 RepID=A0A4R3XZU0_9PROT|nr:Ig-like domain-containing protein [Sulfurirhabdus autotrophica]TCV83394.1 Ig-like domain-containing protein [Sulfurirhabdus autotrophica]